MTSRAWYGLPPALLFFLLGVRMLPYPGAQYDEVLFASALYPPIAVEHRIGNLPLMLMTYLGALKAWLFAPVLALFPPNDWTLRLPVLLAGAASVWLFYLALQRRIGPAWALAGSLLLATDAVYITTTVFDWGPVALQHLFFVLALLALVRYSHDGRARWLFISGLSCGLALWDKALFLWLLAGFGLALIIVFPRPVLAVFRRKMLISAAATGFCLGSLPFLMYNVQYPLKTLTANAAVDEQPIDEKIFRPLESNLAGYSLFGYLARNETRSLPANLTAGEKAVIAVADALGRPQSGWQLYLLLLSLPALLFLRGSENFRFALWAVLGLGLTLSAMAATRGAGASAHHMVLLWPVPHLIIALAATAIARRWAGRGSRITALVLTLGAASNLAVSNQYQAQLIECGPSTVWTDAIRPLMQSLREYPGRTVLATEWGILEQIRFYSRGEQATYYGSDGLIPSLPDPLAARTLEEAMAQAKTIFVGRADGSEIVPDTNAKLNQFAKDRGYAKQRLRLIEDRHRRAIFEVFEYRK